METKKELQSQGGQGYSLCPERGKYEVRYGSGGMKSFNKLSQALKFYENLEEESAIWNFSSLPELIDIKQFN
jgi:hypothetical protein